MRIVCANTNTNDALFAQSTTLLFSFAICGVQEEEVEEEDEGEQEVTVRWDWEWLWAVKLESYF